MSDPIASKTVKHTQRWEVVQSDRIALINQAVTVVGQFTSREEAAISSSIPSVIELTTAELQCYEAALAFLQREFQAGPSSLERELANNDREQSVEFRPHRKPKEDRHMKT